MLLLTVGAGALRVARTAALTQESNEVHSARIGPRRIGLWWRVWTTHRDDPAPNAVAGAMTGSADEET